MPIRNIPAKMRNRVIKTKLTIPNAPSSCAYSGTSRLGALSVQIKIGSFARVSVFAREYQITCSVYAIADCFVARVLENMLIVGSINSFVVPVLTGIEDVTTFFGLEEERAF